MSRLASPDTIRALNGSRHWACTAAGTFSLRPGGTVVTGFALGGLGLACALVVTACGSTSAAPGSTSAGGSIASATGTSTGTEDFAAYRSCLQSHGVTLGGGGLFRGGGRGNGTTTTGGPGTGGPGGRPPLTAAQQQALDACASLRPSGGFGRGGGFGGGAFNSNDPAFAQFQACLRQHGVQTAPAGGTGATGGTTTGTTTRPGGQRRSPAFQAALAACRNLLPAGASAGAGAGGSAGGAAGAADSSTFARFQACLKQHGGGTGASPAKTQAAIAACRSLLPNSGAGTTTTG
jgi:hypothetical protein